MAKLTPFGAELRKLRIDKDMRLFDLAEKLGKSTSMLSAIETGRKPIPDGFVTAISKAMGLAALEIRALRSAKDKTAKEVQVDHLSADNREFVAAFARRLDELPTDLLAKVKKEVLKSVCGETPFLRTRRGIIVPPQSRASLESLAEKVRAAFCDDKEVRIPIMDILELRLPQLFDNYSFEVWDIKEMGADEGRVVPGSDAIILRRDVYDDACRGEARARFTACHELGHFILHQSVAFARSRSDSDPIYRDSEWQADTFAGFLMMSKRHLRKFADINDAARQCGMSPQAAKVMLSKHGSH